MACAGSFNARPEGVRHKSGAASWGVSALGVGAPYAATASPAARRRWPRGSGTLDEPRGGGEMRAQLRPRSSIGQRTQRQGCQGNGEQPPAKRTTATGSYSDRVVSGRYRSRRKDATRPSRSRPERSASRRSNAAARHPHNPLSPEEVATSPSEMRGRRPDGCRRDSPTTRTPKQVGPESTGLVIRRLRVRAPSGAPSLSRRGRSHGPTARACRLRSEDPRYASPAAHRAIGIACSPATGGGVPQPCERGC